MSEYKILFESTVDELQAEVQKYIDQGFRPCGGVTVISQSWEVDRKGYTETELTFYQAVFSDSAPRNRT